MTGRTRDSDKQPIIDAVQRLSESATLDEISETIAILIAIRRGEASADAGQVIAHDEVKRRSVLLRPTVAASIVKVPVGDNPVVPFHLRYTLSRRQRFAAELLPWVPVIAGSLGFTIGIAVLAAEVSLRFLALLLVPLVLYPRLFVLLFDLTIHSGLLVEVSVDDSKLEMQAGQTRLSLPLDGIIQVFRANNAWTVLHFNRSALSIPADAITDEQIDYLKSFARIAAAERKAAQSEH